MQQSLRKRSTNQQSQAISREKNRPITSNLSEKIDQSAITKGKRSTDQKQSLRKDRSISNHEQRLAACVLT